MILICIDSESINFHYIVVVCTQCSSLEPQVLVVPFWELTSLPNLTLEMCQK